MNFSELVEFGPCFSAETVKACALIDLHMTAVKMPFGQTGILLLTWEKCGSTAAQKGPVWSDDGLEEEEVRIFHPRSITSTKSITSPLKSLGRVK